MYGFKGGPAGVMKCKYVELNTDFVYPYRNQVIRTFLMMISPQRYMLICDLICKVTLLKLKKYVGHHQLYNMYVNSLPFLIWYNHACFFRWLYWCKAMPWRCYAAYHCWSLTLLKYIGIEKRAKRVVFFYFQQGGFDMICSGRDKIETPEQVCSFISIFRLAYDY